nr:MULTISPECIES: formate/nitrite transporter family protein [unclassified Exiguobacterium]
MASMEIHALESLRKKAQASSQMIHYRPMEYFLRAMLAGIFIGFASIFTLKVVNGMYLIDSPFTTLIGGFSFGIALVMIIYGGAELFTGNTMYFTTSTMRGYTTLSDTMLVWLLCFVGNALGGVLFALLLAPTGVIQELGMDNWLFSVVESKMHHTTVEIFFRAIFCNWMVCLAIFLPKQMKNEFAQIFSMIFLVAVFFASGFDHVIANFVLFALTLVVPHPEAISFAGAIHNLIPATFGNIIGGALFMGAIYTWLNAKGLREAQESEEKEEVEFKIVKPAKEL